jgi:hypothetical protein
MTKIKFKAWLLERGKQYFKYKIRSGRGGTYTSEITVILDNLTRIGAITIIAKTYFNIIFPIWLYIVIYLIQKTIEYFIGWWDENHFGLWKYENEYSSRRLNPWNTELMEKIDEINSKL